MRKLIEHWFHPKEGWSVKTYNEGPQEFFDKDGKQIDYDPRTSAPVVDTPAPVAAPTEPEPIETPASERGAEVVAPEQGSSL